MKSPGIELDAARRKTSVERPEHGLTASSTWLWRNASVSSCLRTGLSRACCTLTVLQDLNTLLVYCLIPVLASSASVCARFLHLKNKLRWQLHICLCAEGVFVRNKGSSSVYRWIHKLFTRLISIRGYLAMNGILMAVKLFVVFWVMAECSLKGGCRRCGTLTASLLP
jgi:hypothetical protein